MGPLYGGILGSIFSRSPPSFSLFPRFTRTYLVKLQKIVIIQIQSHSPRTFSSPPHETAGIRGPAYLPEHRSTIHFVSRKRPLPPCLQLSLHALHCDWHLPVRSRCCRLVRSPCFCFSVPRTPSFSSQYFRFFLRIPLSVKLLRFCPTVLGSPRSAVPAVVSLAALCHGLPHNQWKPVQPRPACCNLARIIRPFMMRDRIRKLYWPSAPAALPCDFTSSRPSVALVLQRFLAS